MGRAQMELLPKLLAIKAEDAARYRDFVAATDVRFVDSLPSTTANSWLNARVLEAYAERDALLEYTNSRDVMTRPYGPLPCVTGPHALQVEWISIGIS